MSVKMSDFGCEGMMKWLNVKQMADFRD